MKFIVSGETLLVVTKTVDIPEDELVGLDDNEIRDLAIERAYDTFSGVESFVGHGGLDKLVGVYKKDESIYTCDDVEFSEVMVAEDGYADEDEDGDVYIKEYNI